MGKLLDAVREFRVNAKLRRGQCDECKRILPDSGAPFDYNTCSQECSFERWASVTA